MGLSDYTLPIAMFTLLICVSGLAYINITHQEQAAQTANSFCHNYARSGRGLLSTPEYFCEGKEFVCSEKECWYVTSELETNSDNKEVIK